MKAEVREAMEGCGGVPHPRRGALRVGATPPNSGGDRETDRDQDHQTDADDPEPKVPSTGIVTLIHRHHLSYVYRLDPRLQSSNLYVWSKVRAWEPAISFCFA